MSDYLTKNLTRQIPQTEQEHDLQVKNSAGGFSFKVTPEIKLERFLILGSEGGTYYIEEKDLTKQNIDNLKYLTTTNAQFVVDKAVDVSVNARSYKNNAAIFALAYVMTFGDDKAKSYARVRVNEVVRTSTHLFTFNKYLKLLAPGSGLGTSRNRAIAAWYENKTTDQIAYQAVKYRQREGWTHRDALRQSRPKGIDPNLANWILGKETSSANMPQIVQHFIRVQNSKSEFEVVELLDLFKDLPWEALPTQFLKSEKVWKKLFYNGQLNGQALVRNITRLARLKAFDDLVFARDYATKLTDKEMIAKTRLHPINYLNALTVHMDGQINRQGYGIYYSMNRNKDWQSSQIIFDALNDGYALSFASVEPSNKRTLIGVDISGSMSSAAALGLDLSAAQVAGAMASVIAKTEPYYQIMGFADQFRDLGITANMNLYSVMKSVQMQNFGRTDCALPMQWAYQNNREFDTFIVITDNETWFGKVHPHVALQNYRNKTGIPARLIVVGVAANDFTIANPEDAGMLDLCGVDSNLPKLISEFSKGNI